MVENCGGERKSKNECRKSKRNLLETERRGEMQSVNEYLLLNFGTKKKYPDHISEINETNIKFSTMEKSIRFQWK